MPGWRSIALRVLGDDPALRYGKPEPDPFLLACRRLGVAARDAGPSRTHPPEPVLRWRQAARCMCWLPEGVGPSAYPPEVRCLRSLTAVQTGGERELWRSRISKGG